MDKDDLILVTGAGGFIGGSLVADLHKNGYRNIRAVDRKPLGHWFQLFPVDNQVLDLQHLSSCAQAVAGARHVFNLAADMGGIGFIRGNRAACMLRVLTSTNMLVAARDAKLPGRFFYSSSACVYPEATRDRDSVIPLKESDAYPADCEDGYGWEKLFSERMCRHFREDFGLETRVARFHNVYGPMAEFDGGREKAPLALCRKVIQALNSNRNEIVIWGDGQQTRSFIYIDDLITGMLKIAASDILEPVNLGSAVLVRIDQLVDMIEEIAGTKVKRIYDENAVVGVYGRNSDNTMIKQKLNWEPSISLRQGMEITYRWIYNQIETRGRI